ncbi:MAG: phosphoribosylanthranilate isomerase [Verrucomicrobiota bacterium]|nr:phosphoribosylanthranilate isomerase [Verrucomicrobiota bacterium]
MEWIRKVEGIERVAVLVNPTLDDALMIAALDGIDSLQLHGNESQEFCERLVAAGAEIIKALPATPALLEIALSDYRCARVLLDTPVRGRFGGTGEMFDWLMAAELVRRNPGLEIIIAGGLTPSNVGAAIALATPAGVDVSGGVELSPSRKDHAVVQHFVVAAKRS